MRTWIVIAFAAWLGFPALASEPPKSVSVLWLGNSFTGLTLEGYNIPKMTEELVNGAKGRLTIGKADCVILWGKTLKDHWEFVPGQNNQESSLDKIRSGRFDIVIIQDYLNTDAAQSAHGSHWMKDGEEQAQRYLDYLKRIVDEVRKAGAVPVIYAHHRNSDSEPENWDYIAEVFARGQKETGAIMVPAGSVWRKAFQEVPGLILHNLPEDKHHQGLNGMYLNACLFYSLLLNQSPEGCPTLASIPEETARQLQKIAWETMKDIHPSLNPADLKRGPARLP